MVLICIPTLQYKYTVFLQSLHQSTKVCTWYWWYKRWIYNWNKRSKGCSWAATGYVAS